MRITRGLRSSSALVLLLLGAGALHACAHASMTCAERADEKYRHCVNPYVVVNQGEPSEPVSGDQAQACRDAYQQAMAQCTGRPAAPTVDLFPDGGVRTSSASK